MANELKHSDPGTELTQSEFNAVGLHVFDSQATGDIAYASSGTQLSRLAKGADNTFLQMGGSNIPEWVQDITIQGASGSAMNQYWFGDAGEDNADKWRWSVADGGTMTLDSYISGSYVTHLTVTPHATVASSSISTLGGLASGGLTIDGNKTVTVGDGAFMHLDTATVTDGGTSGSGTAAKYTHVNIEAPTLAATNSSVTTSDAATVYINAPATAGSNQTITRNWSLWVDTGNARFDGSIYSGTTEAINSSGLLQVTNQSNIAGLGTITSGTWQGTDVGVAHGGTGVSTLTANGVLIGNGTSAITSVAMATKGQVLIGDGSGNPSMLTVGNDDQVLTADASVTHGVKWADAGGGGLSAGKAIAFSLVF